MAATADAAIHKVRKPIVEPGQTEERFQSENEFVSQFQNAQTKGRLAMD